VRIVYALIIASLLLACAKHKEKSPPINKKKFTVAYEHYLAFVTSDTAKPELYPAYLDSALKEADMSKKEFDKAIDYLKEHPEEFEQVLTDINSYLQELEKQKKAGK